MSACAPSGVQPLTEAEALTVMRTWRVNGNMVFQSPAGFCMLAMSHTADQLASALVAAGYGIRRWHAIELNAAGVALWDEAWVE